MLEKGEKPDQFAPNRTITQKHWDCSLSPQEGYSSPIKIGFQFVQYLEENPNATYDDLSSKTGITKARVCQMIALCKRLSEEITVYLSEIDKPKILQHFTERKLRPLTLLNSYDEKIYRFNEMKKSIDS